VANLLEAIKEGDCSGVAVGVVGLRNSSEEAVERMDGRVGVVRDRGEEAMEEGHSLLQL
jgi:hypothetical protein